MNYKKVIEDFNNGTIDPEKFRLVMDNDSGYWLCTDYSFDDWYRDDLEQEMQKKYGKPGGERDIVDVLNAAGVPCERC
jgi:hypothetical protein